MWIETLLEKVTSFIPRPIIIRPDEGGFRQIPKPWGGCWVTELKPGNWYLLVPLIMENEICKTKTQVKDIRIQSVQTKDGVDFAIGVTIRYYIINPLKALLEVFNYDESLQNIILGIVHDYVETHTEQELKENRNLLKDQLLKSVREEAAGWGLKIYSVKLSDFGKTINYRILMDDKIGLRMES